MKRFLQSRLFRTTLGLAISGLALYLALQDVSFPDVWSTLSEARSTFVLLAVGSVVINTLAKAVRWRILLGAGEEQVAFPTLLMHLLVGQLLNTFFPGRVGDLSRAYSVGGLGLGRTFVLGTVAIEKLFDLVTYAALFVILLLLIPLPDWVGTSIYTLVGVALAAVLVLVLVLAFWEHFLALQTWILDRLPARIRDPLKPRLLAGAESLDVFRSRRGVSRAVLWTALIWATALLNNYLVLGALEIEVPVTASLLILVALQAGISASAVPGTIGLFEYLCVLSLSVFGVERTAAFGYGILLHAVVLFPPTLAGILAFFGLSLAGKRPEPAGAGEG